MLFICPNFSLEPMTLTPRCGHGAQQYHTASTKTNDYSCVFRAIGIGLAGKIVGCKTACTANLDGTPQDSANCCTGSHNVPATCPPSDVQYYSYFKNGCKNAYAYAYDESSKTALGTCDSSKNADYAVTFCP
ncbi:hypothetical protein D9757_012027 [Collybiopsis confluens]|uniref:Thaumatin-like protein n=1 Tax=Collybiopsis confluens TaxID=2823264 RepID=A0A8H5GDU2_9AGAR|nr:hypothetical protein D9757_012027 [Collybiopsis confluens]